MLLIYHEKNLQLMSNSTDVFAFNFSIMMHSSTKIHYLNKSVWRSTIYEVYEGDGEGEGGYGGISGEEEGNADYGVMVQPSQRHVAPCVKVVEWGLGTRSWKMLVAFWAGISPEDAQDAGIVPRW